jgi:hypothetical protein
MVVADPDAVKRKKCSTQPGNVLNGAGRAPINSSLQ